MHIGLPNTCTVHARIKLINMQSCSYMYLQYLYGLSVLQGSSAQGSIDAHSLFKVERITVKNGWTAFGTGSYAFAQFDNFAVTSA